MNNLYSIHAKWFVKLLYIKDIFFYQPLKRFKL